MNLILFSTTDYICENKIRLIDQRFSHIKNIHRAQLGDSVRLGLSNGAMGSGTITALDKKAVELAVHLDQDPPAKLPLTLILALPRPKMLRRILRSTAELGVNELHLIHSFRVEKSYWQTPVLEQANIDKYLIQGLQQAKDTVLPNVYTHKAFKPFVEDIFPSLIKTKRVLLAHPGSDTPCPHNIAEATTLIVGPEGGFIAYEVDKFQQAGASCIDLGERILRVENAVTYLIGRLF